MNLTNQEVIRIVRLQHEVCKRVGAEFFPTPGQLKLGISKNVGDGTIPINGLRHPPEGDTCGCYVWAGEEFSRDPDFFQPLHVIHLQERCPEIQKFLGLPPGWRFLIAPGHEDVWHDESLLGRD